MIEVGEWLLATEVKLAHPGKTKRWAICEKGARHAELGVVAWYCPWRRYAFTPGHAVFEAGCMRAIAEFLDRATLEHKAAARAAKA